MTRSLRNPVVPAAIAVGRTALAVVALVRPDVPARPWVGAAPDPLAAQVFGRALGGRDLALGAGTLCALAGRRDARGWILAGALADAVDAGATLRSWRRLPPAGRVMVFAAAAGAAAAGLLSLRRSHM